MKSYLLVIALIFILIGCKKNEDEYGQLSGTVKSRFGQTIEGATITINTSPVLLTKSDNSGDFSIEKIKVNTYQITISKDNFVSLSEQVSIAGNSITRKDFVLDPGAPVLTISDTLLHVASKNDSKSILVSSNTSWNLKNDNSWISCSVESGAGNKSLIINIQENLEETPRTGVVEFSVGNVTRKLTIIQDFAVKLVNFTGYDAKPKLIDSIFLIFNKQVKIIRVSCSNVLFGENNGTYINDSYGFRFEFKSARLGGSYPIEYTVSDNSGIVYSGTQTISFYSQKKSFQGIITDFFITSDNQHCWVAVKNPDKLILLSLKDLEILKEYPLNFVPYRIRLNVYNDKIYILAGYTYTGIFDSHIYLFDQNKEMLVKTISLQPHPDDHPSYPAIYPYDICFTKSGFGIVLSVSNGSSGANYDIIDSSKGDTIYSPSEDWMDKNCRLRLISNYDLSKIFISKDIGDGTLIEIDGITHANRKIIPPFYDLVGGILANRINNKLYISGHEEAYIMNLDDNQMIGKPSVGLLGEFSYKINEENFVYTIDWDNNFALLDYEQGITIIAFPAKIYSPFTYYRKFMSSTDGKYLIFGDDNFLYLFDTDMFKI